MPDHGVHVVGEIEHGAAVRQVDHLALGRQRIDALLGQLRHRARRPGSRLRSRPLLAALFQQLAHPRDLAVEGLVAALAAFLVAPVRGHAEFRLRVHLVGADLHFQRAPFRADHRGVQRAVVVGLGPGDVIVELAGDRQPQRMHHAQRGVAGGHVVHEHAHRAQVVEFFDRHLLLLHLPPDAVDVLRPPADLGGDAVFAQRALAARPSPPTM